MWGISWTNLMMLYNEIPGDVEQEDEVLEGLDDLKYYL